MGPELFRLKDRNMQDLVLAPTHEEAFTYILKDHIKSYRDLPLSVYHIGFKFRDEIRPRFGVMRGKTFIMKDAYSFHRETDSGSLDKTYNDMAIAYRRIFARCGLETIPVTADSGSMGGSDSEEFMVPSRVGEEEIIKCEGCGYVANREKAESKPEKIDYTDTGRIAPVETPEIKTIEQLTEFLKVSPKNTIKSLVYKTSDEKYVMALIRGDLGLNETKLKNYLNIPEIVPADGEETKEKLGIPLGFVGPVGVENVSVVADYSIKDIKGGVTGANQKDLHFINVNADRDFKPADYIDLRLTGEGDLCPVCGKELVMFRGIELGHIFKLGDKYSKAFCVTYLDEDGTTRIPTMGCYGIGVERTAAAVIEQNHDDDGIKWPISVAPFHVHLLSIKHEGEIKDLSVEIYRDLERAGVEVLLDDREERAGIKFKDADLIGIPFRVTIGEKGLKEGNVELFNRKTREREKIKSDDIVECLKKRVALEKENFISIADKMS
jgi:prolyl-tRNA synthetase